jgi:hypothetical protein
MHFATTSGGIFIPGQYHASSFDHHRGNMKDTHFEALLYAVFSDFPLPILSFI